MSELVGREQELRTLLGLLDDARGGRGRAVLLLGDAGIGKTRLAEAFAATAASAGIAVAWGRCTEAEAPPYWPWRQAFRSLRGSSARPLAADRSPTVRERLFADVADGLEAATSEAPAVIVLEDLHWADASSLAMLRFAIGVLPDLPLVIVLTARDDPLELTDVAATALRDLPPAVHRLPLAGLDQAATALIVRSLCGIDVPDSFVIDVHHRTGGNPFFVHEVGTLRALHGERSGMAVPPGVRQVVGRRLARLSQSAHDVLALAAVAGDELDPELLAMITNRQLDDVLGLLDEASRSRLVVHREATLEFAHALVRETLYESQSHAMRSEIHGTVAEALEALAARRERTDGLDAQIAAHWRRASRDDDRQRAGPHAVAAARIAIERMAYEQAARYYRWALDAGMDDRLMLTLGMGEAQVLAGELAAGRATLTVASAIAGQAGREDELARAVLAMGGGIGGFEVKVGDKEQIRLLEEALRLLPDGDGSLRAAVLGRLSIAVAGSGTEERRIDLAREAAAMAQRVGDAPAEVAALAAYCDAVAGPDHVDERTRATERMIELASAGDDPRPTLLARRIRVVALLERGEFALADAEIASYTSEADRLRSPLYHWPVPMWLGMRALMRGDLELAWRFSEEAEDLGHRAESFNAKIMVMTLRLGHALATGTSASMADQSRWIAEEFSSYPAMPTMIAATAFEADPELSRAMFERARAGGIEVLDRDSEWLEAAWMFGESGMRYGDADMVTTAYDALVPYAELWAVDGIGAACFGVTAHQLGRLAAFLDRREEADRWLRHALERHQAAGAGLLAAFTEWALAEVGTATSRRRAFPAREGEFRRDGRIWRVRWQGETATVPDSKGVRDLATLIRVPGREIHVLDLVEASAGPSARDAGSDAGPILDRQARDAYRQRLAELEHEVAQADDHHDAGRAAALREERDFLAAELGGAFGLGGRDRRVGDRVERARKAVAMRIGTAFRAIAETHPALARHLRVSVATGRFCVYRPEEPVHWQL